MQQRRSQPISQIDIENELLRLLDALETETEAFERMSMTAAKADAAYKREWAKEYLAAKGSVKEREAWADYKLAQLIDDHKIAEALLKATREKLTSLRSAIDALRSLNANVRFQVQ